MPHLQRRPAPAEDRRRADIEEGLRECEKVPHNAWANVSNWAGIDWSMSDAARSAIVCRRRPRDGAPRLCGAARFRTAGRPGRELAPNRLTSADGRAREQTQPSEGPV